jgi:hypothetical protein
MVQVSESDYKTAQQGNERVRQEFIDAIDLGDAGEFVRKVLYHKKIEYRKSTINEIRMCPQRVMCCVPNKSVLFDRLFDKTRIVGKSIIEVHPYSFEGLGYQYFLSALIDHEGYHARQMVQNCSGYEIIDNRIRNSDNFPELKYLISLLEVPAYNSQLFRRGLRKLSEKEVEDTQDIYESYFRNLFYLPSRLPVPSNAKEDLKRILCDSEADQIVREKILPTLNI